MTAVTRRIAKLEEQFGTVAGKPRIQIILSYSGWGLALDEDTCIQILGEEGFLPTSGAALLPSVGVTSPIAAESLRLNISRYQAGRITISSGGWLLTAFRSPTSFSHRRPTSTSRFSRKFRCARRRWSQPEL
jgi:hypothetical protein